VALPPRGIPLSTKVVLTALVLVWATIYWRGYGPSNFLWFCDLANFLIIVALWTESPLLLSSQAVSVILPQTVWSVDVASRLVTGGHAVGVTKDVFDPSIALSLRLASLFHVAVPPVVLWALSRIGYDRRGWLLQTGIAWVVLPLGHLAAPDRNINFVRGPFESPQTLLPPIAYLLVLMIGYPLVLYLPGHLLLRSLLPAAPRSRARAS
jgi:hypothetical protein